MLDIYCFDTGPFIELGKLPRAIFPGPWTRIEELIRAGRLITPREVITELEEGTDDLARWARLQPGLIRPNDQLLVQAAIDVLRDFPGLVNPNKPGGGAADPFVVGLARIERDAGQLRTVDQYKCIVVTQERAKPTKQNIPAACAMYGLPFCSLNDVYVAEGWVFG